MDKDNNCSVTRGGSRKETGMAAHYTDHDLHLDRIVRHDENTIYY